MRENLMKIKFVNKGIEMVNLSSKQDNVNDNSLGEFRTKKNGKQG